MAVVRNSSGGHHHHSTLDAHDEFSLANMVDTEANSNGRGLGSDVEITAAQKMVSAMSGSLLTSLFCKFAQIVTIPIYIGYVPEVHTSTNH
jgi:solute carrier family 25, member 39/40